VRRSKGADHGQSDHLCAALFGVAHFTSDNGTVRSSDNAFTMRAGGALDVNVNQRFFVRPHCVDYAQRFSAAALKTMCSQFRRGVRSSSDARFVRCISSQTSHRQPSFAGSN